MYGHKAHSGPSMITTSNRALVAKCLLLVKETLGRPLGSRIKVSVCCAGLGRHRSDSEVLVLGEGTLSQTLSARVPVG